MVRSVLTRFLGKLGFDVIATGEVHEALAWMAQRTGEIALVCLDLTMPGMSGSEVLRAVGPHVPILLVSGYTANPEVPALLDLGAAGFLAKPFRLDELAKGADGTVRTSICRNPTACRARGRHHAGTATVRTWRLGWSGVGR